MRTFVHALVCLLLLYGGAHAQRSNFYMFAGLGGATHSPGTSATTHLGAGGELVLLKGIGVGAELGILGFHNTYGVFSANGYYHLPPHDRDRRFDPFLTVGYSGFVLGGGASLVNFGGGMNYWFLERLGVRLEFRDHYWSRDPVSRQFWGVRLGVVLH